MRVTGHSHHVKTNLGATYFYFSDEYTNLDVPKVIKSLDAQLTVFWRVKIHIC